MELTTIYMHTDILHEHTLSDTCIYSPKIDRYSDMPPACHPADIATPWLSIRCVLSGALHYMTDDGGFHLITSNTYLILNENHSYSVEPSTPDIDTAEIVQSFGVFFPRTWASDVLRTLVTAPNVLLDESQDNSSIPIEFFERRFIHDEVVTPRLRELYALSQSGYVDSQLLEIHLYELLAGMIHIQHGAFREAERLPASRASTRTELYRRLHLARDMIHANLEQRLTLAEMAKVAALSPYHFARSFKQAFEQTPYEYLTQLRLAKAQSLLTQTYLPVTEVCYAVGFKSLPSFINLFRRCFGVSPRQFRKEASK